MQITDRSLAPYQFCRNQKAPYRAIDALAPRLHEAGQLNGETDSISTPRFRVLYEKLLKIDGLSDAASLRSSTTGVALLVCRWIGLR